MCSSFLRDLRICVDRDRLRRVGAGAGGCGIWIERKCSKIRVVADMRLETKSVEAGHAS